ncbi:macrophage mannose receptor 1-like [Sardina pilchardus]|uniref:macrophage mannose receptor 1-like n=1 Tax=Sardina pilchardus TaxID=27697 RepID=UPI002E166F7F
MFTFTYLTGLGSLSSSVPRQFHVVKEKKSWTEAQQYCREKFTDLATIDDMTENKKVKSMMQEAGGNSTHPYVLIGEVKDWRNWIDAQRYCREEHTDLASVRNQAENDQIEEVRGDSQGPWIGLFRDAWEWSDGSSSSFRHWGTGEPDDLGLACTEIMPSGQWKDADCKHPDGSHFICYEDELVLVRENKTWREALQYCREHHVDLVSVTSERVQRWVSERAKGASTAHVWVGLLHCYNLGWYWVSGQNVSYSNWTPGHEQVGSDQQRLGAVESGGGQWVSDLTEADQLNFICTTEE